MRHLYEIDEIETIHKIESLISSIKIKLLPTFESIDAEAKNIEKERLNELSKRFNPDTMDESEIYEDTFFRGVDHYIEQTSMKKEFLKSAAVWLFHLFEKSCTYIFNTNDGNQKKSILTNLSINTTNSSNWFKCNTELRHLANTIKHGKGWSYNELQKLRPGFFKDYVSHLSDINIEIQIEDLEEYASEMKAFWESFFSEYFKIPYNKLHQI